MLTINRLQPQFGSWKFWNDFHNEMNELLSARSLTSDPRVKLWAKDNAVLLSIDLPGRQPDDVHVSVHQDLVTIDAEPVSEEPAEQVTVLRREREQARESRQIRLPFQVDTDRVEAVYERGTLQVTLHRHEATLPTKITVKPGQTTTA